MTPKEILFKHLNKSSIELYNEPLEISRMDMKTCQPALDAMEEYANQQNDYLVYENQQLKDQIADMIKEMHKYQEIKNL